MLYTYPDYYDDFRCVADKCEDTCCAGWQIVIDDESMDKYKKYKGEFSSTLQGGIDYKEEVFRQDRCGRCIFLDKNNLCDIYKNMGEDALCDTCARYPRHIEEFENIREYNLSISCPYVARIILNHYDKVNYFETDKEEDDEEFEDYDILLYSYLEEGRRIIKDILQDRSISVTDRMSIVWEFADNMQKAIDSDDMFDGKLFMSYSLDNYKLNSTHKKSFGYHFFKEVCRLLWNLEMISKDWEYQLMEIDTILYSMEVDDYEKVSLEYEEWINNNMKEQEIYLEQIVVYYIYTYMCGAVYDGYVDSKIRMSIVSTLFINEMLKARWIKNNRMIDFDDVVYVTYRYSRQLEHSDDNLEAMEELVNTLPSFMN